MHSRNGDDVICLEIFFFKLLLGRDDLMMALFFAQRVILTKTKFEEVPTTLKQQVANILVDSGLPELVTEEKYLVK